mmetsp:Transcript_44260/g.140999  ORF Transcript_44260/g.140999 Transcript_44260/m.140999 type:complete len:292 (-) Transcript_44260:77-952(-)
MTATRASRTGSMAGAWARKPTAASTTTSAAPSRMTKKLPTTAMPGSPTGRLAGVQARRIGAAITRALDAPTSMPTTAARTTRSGGLPGARATRPGAASTSTSLAKSPVLPRSTPTTATAWGRSGARLRGPGAAHTSTSAACPRPGPASPATWPLGALGPRQKCSIVACIGALAARRSQFLSQCLPLRRRRRRHRRRRRQSPMFALGRGTCGPSHRRTGAASIRASVAPRSPTQAPSRASWARPGPRRRASGAAATGTSAAGDGRGAEEAPGVGRPGASCASAFWPKRERCF